MFIPSSAIPIRAAQKSTHVAIVITARGGHIGFLDGFWPNTKDEYMARLFTQYFSSTLLSSEFDQVAENMMDNFHRNAYETPCDD